MSNQETRDFVDVLTGKLKLKLSVKPHPIDEYANRLIEANRRDQAKMSEAQHRAALCRGC